MARAQAGLRWVVLAVVLSGAAGLGAEAAADSPSAPLLLDGPATLDRKDTCYLLTRDISADGTAFTISADNVTLDLGGHTVVYNAKPSARPVHGISVAAFKSGVTIKNGCLIQGEGKSAESPAIHIVGGSGDTGRQNLHHLIVKVHGERCNDIAAPAGYGFYHSKIHHCFVLCESQTKRMDGEGADCIAIAARPVGGVEIFDNILVGGHRGIYAAWLGTGNPTPALSRIFNNLVQQARREGCKSPYGIVLAKSHNTKVFSNQVVSDEGRGITLDGFEQGAREGCSGNAVYDNLIDVQYSTRAGQGAYVENNVYGIRCRYSSGDNEIYRNRVFVTNELQQGQAIGMYLGSDAKDPRMGGVKVYENEIFARQASGGGSAPQGATGISLDWIDNLSITNNRITSDACPVYNSNAQENVTIDKNILLQPATGKKWSKGMECAEGGRFTGINATEHTPSDSTAPAPPQRLRLYRFPDGILLRWDASPDKDVEGYIVYRDGKKLPVSPRAGAFFWDRMPDEGKPARYEVGAVDFSGNEGARCEAVSTKNAVAGLAYWVTEEARGLPQKQKAAP